MSAFPATLGNASEKSGQSYPGRPLRAIVPWPAGGWNDIVARMLAQKLHGPLGQPVVVDNRAGASGIVGAEVAARSAPDGYTLLVTSNSLVLAASVYAKVAYDVIKDFVAITLVTSTPYIMLVHPSVPTRTVKEFIALAKARPGELNYASSGNGTPPHLGVELFKSIARIDMAHIPHKGAAPALNDVLAGHVSMVYSNPTIGLSQVKAGRTRALAVTTAKRLTAAPDIPTLAEAGVRGAEVDSWTAVFAPAGTAQAIVMRLHTEILKIIGDPQMKSRLQAEGAEAIGMGPDELEAYIRTEVVKWAKVAKQVGLRIN